MKRITVLIAAMLFAVVVSGQNYARYVYHFSGGLSIGGVYKGATNANIDSLVNDAGVLKFYSGGAEVPTSGTVDTTFLSTRIDSMLNKADTVTILDPYATTLEVRDEIADSLNAFRTNAEEGSTFYALHAPDTVQHTANYTVAASDWRKDQHLNKATSIVVTIPPDLTEWPVGGIMNFYSFGAGITVFKGGAGVVLVSPLDSIATSIGKQDVSVKKIAANKYKLIGPLTD